MENKTSRKYDILMIVWGLSLGVIELWLIHLGFFDRINISCINKNKQKLENKNKIMRKTNCILIIVAILGFV